MIHKICNYLAIISLSLTLGGSALAFTDNAVINTILVDDDNKFSFYQRILNGGEKDSVTIEVKPGKTAKIFIHSAREVALTIQSPDGQTKTFSESKFFRVKIPASGKYVLEVNSLFSSHYKMEVLTQ